MKKERKEVEIRAVGREKLMAAIGRQLEKSWGTKKGVRIAVEMRKGQL